MNKNLQRTQIQQNTPTFRTVFAAPEYLLESGRIERDANKKNTRHETQATDRKFSANKRVHNPDRLAKRRLSLSTGQPKNKRYKLKYNDECVEPCFVGNTVWVGGGGGWLTVLTVVRQKHEKKM